MNYLSCSTWHNDVVSHWSSSSSSSSSSAAAAVYRMRNHGDKMTQHVHSRDALWDGDDAVSADRSVTGPSPVRRGRLSGVPTVGVGRPPSPSRRPPPPPSIPLGTTTFRAAADERHQFQLVAILFRHALAELSFNRNKLSVDVPSMSKFKSRWTIH